MKIIIIGSGNAASVLGRMMVKAGHLVMQVCGRNKNAVALLAKELNANAETDLKNISTEADLYFIAVNDDNVVEIAKTLKLKNKLVVHTAGSVSKKILKNVSENYGVLYPLQSLRKDLEYLPIVPLLVDGNSENAKKELIDFAKTISENVAEADDEQRLKLHVAAVVVSNFTNHLFALTKDFCEKENVDFKVLFPLIKETVLRIEKHEPSEMQTGPAIRGDNKTIEKHLELLKNYASLGKIYQVMSESIIKTKKH
jgi:predicted short-subunit dehydrogenase-like oxidoreductase (DUF2520 family)